MDALAPLTRNTGVGGRGRVNTGEPPLATWLWGMIYADHAGVVSQSPEQLKMMSVIVVVCAAFGLTVSEAKTEITCLRTKGMLESTAIFNVQAAGYVYTNDERVRIPRGELNHNADLSIEVDRRIHNAWCTFRKCTLELNDRPSALLEFKIIMLKAEVLDTMLYGCVTWSSCVCHYNTLRRAYHSLLTHCFG